MTDNEINVYWTNCNELFLEMDKSMWYNNPDNLYQKHALNKNTDVPENGTTMFMCPAVRDKMLNTWSFSSTVDMAVTIESENIIFSKGIPLHPTPRQNSINNTGHVWFDLGWLFFSEEPLIASFTSPYFDKVDYLSKMAIPPASFDIGKWFRPFNAEYIIWDTKESEIIINAGDPLFYVEFFTNKKINLIRFEQSQKLLSYATGCSKSTQFYGRNTPLKNRYDIFEKTNMKDIILKEIKDNIIKP